MAAILGLSDETVDGICSGVRDNTDSAVQVANYNSPGQVVISGGEDALQLAMALAEEAGARKVVRLAVSIAAHSSLMSPASATFRTAVRGAALGPATIPVVGNVTAEPLVDREAIETELVQQLTAPVRWTDSVRWVAAQGVDTVLEVGPGQVLTGLVKRIDRGLRRLCAPDAVSIELLGGA
jgi:[acyl-carrier-protein] S-malonyltransferase